MKLKEMKAIKESRENAIGFLHHTDISMLNNSFNGFFKVDKKSFNEICDTALTAYDQKLLSNKAVSSIFRRLEKTNSLLISSS